YWLGTNFVSKFAEKAIRNISVSKAGIVSGNDALFLKNWYEINDFNITYDAENFKNRMKYKWIPINKGGTFRKWYGNTEQIINIHDLWNSDKVNVSVRRSDQDYYFRKAIT